MSGRRRIQHGQIETAKSWPAPDPENDVGQPNSTLTGTRLEIDRLRSFRQAVTSPWQDLPAPEEAGLDALGRLAYNCALLQMDEEGGLSILRAGPFFESWLGCRAAQLKLTDLSSDKSHALHALFVEAGCRSKRVTWAEEGVRDGSLRIYELIALPLSNHRDRRLFLVHIEEREKPFRLVETLFQTAHDGLAALTVIHDAAGRPHDFQIADLNDSAAGLFRSTVPELIGRRLSELAIAPLIDQFQAALIAIFNNGGRGRFDIDAAGSIGGRNALSISASFTCDFVAVTLTDISHFRVAEDSFRLFFTSNPVPTFLCDCTSLAFLAVNDAALAHYGYSRDKFLRLTLLDILPQEDKESVRNAIANNPILGGGPNHVWRHLKADGTTIDVLTYWRATEFHNRPAELVAVMDVTEKRKVEARITYMAHHDTLTGLPNRILFHERLAEALGRVLHDKSQFAVLFLDLDRFKSVNDTLGHPIGDLLLKAAAERLRECLRESDTVARFGGDEFAVLQMGIHHSHEVSALAERIVQLLGEPYEIEGQLIVAGVSAGIALAPEHGTSADLLLKNADLALYQAKEDGRRSYRFFEQKMDVRIQMRRGLELDLRHAFTADEFEIHYQPLIGLESWKVTGFEALLRWRHPIRGMVPPREFIPIAEEIGLIAQLGEWVLQQACAEAANWPAELKVAVNLSPIQFKNGDLTKVVLSALASAGLPGQRLELEITEAFLLTTSEVHLATLRRLRDLGISISMEDFGTGYSGMSHLGAFPFDRIKIDRSFVAELHESADCMKIVRAITRLGTSLGIHITAEGVETQKQLDLLRGEGCSEMQGFLVSWPMPADQIPSFLASHHQERQARQTKPNELKPAIEPHRVSRT
ncbi:MAG: EAL domain-containing protein [Alphaproteobacteria bacterium]|nr:EAL domain-containing protein [Alphaproteobacteria bacterium]